MKAASFDTAKVGREFLKSVSEVITVTFEAAGYDSAFPTR